MWHERDKNLSRAQRKGFFNRVTMWVLVAWTLNDKIHLFQHARGMFMLISVSLRASHLISYTEHTQRPWHLLPTAPPILPNPPLFPTSVHSSPLFSVCVCVCVVGEHGPIAGGKSSNLLRWPSSDRVIHPYPFTSPTHSNLFLLLPPKQPPKESVYVTGTRSECRLSAKDAKLCHKPREQRHSAAGQCES